MAKKSSSDFIDFQSLFKQYKSKWYLFVISLVVCGALGVFYIKVHQPEYAVKANVLISPEKEDGGVADAALGSISSLFGSRGDVDDEIFIISSHSLYKNVVKELGLNITQMVRKNIFVREYAFPEQPVSITSQDCSMDTLKHSMVIKLNVSEEGKASISAKIKRSVVAKAKNVSLPYTIATPLGHFTIAKTEYYPQGEGLNDIISITGYDSAAENLAMAINTEIASKRSHVISLDINTTNPDYGKAVLDDVIAQYNRRGMQEQNQHNALTAKFIDNRLDILARELSEAEGNVQKYKQDKGILDVGSEARYQTEKRARVEEELLKAETQAEIIAMTLSFIKEPANKYSLIPANVDNEGLTSAIQSYNSMVLGRMSLENSAMPDNTALKLLSEKIDLTRGNIQASFESALKTARVAVRDLQAQMAAAQGTLAGIPAQEREYRDLVRQQSVKQQLFMFLLQRREQTSMMLANALPKGTVVDSAYTLTEPLGLSKKMVLLLAIFMGLIIPPVWLYLRRLLYNRFETRAEIERITDVPILGEMCIDDSGRSLVVGGEDTSASAELFRLMRSNLLFVLNDPRDKVVLMTSTSSGEGKSFISINLAASLALLGKKVLLIGMDIRNPRLAEYLHLQPRFGLTQYLSSDGITISSLINRIPDIPGLDVICAGPVPPNPAELLLSNKVDQLFQELRAGYDYIIVDTAPIGLVSDTFTLDRIADAAIYVCRANYTSMSDLTLINDIYEQHRLKKVSMVINGTASKKTYGYGKKYRS